MRAFVWLACCLAIVLASLTPLCARAQATQGTVYAVDYDSLYSVDLGTRNATYIGAAGNNGPSYIADLSGLTEAPNGTLYAASDTIKSLVTFDRTTGAATVVGNFGIDPTQFGLPRNAALDFGMTYGCHGQLWLSSATAHELWQVDPASGHATAVGSLGYTISGLAMYGGKLVGAGAISDEGLYAIDTSNANATLVGEYGSAVPYTASVSPGVDAGGRLLAALNYVPPPAGQTQLADWSDLAQIDPTTGAATVLGPITGSPATLKGIGVRGISFGVPDCMPHTNAGDPPANPYAVPTLNDLARWLEMLGMLMLVGVTLVRRRRSRR